MNFSSIGSHQFFMATFHTVVEGPADFIIFVPHDVTGFRHPLFEVVADFLIPGRMGAQYVLGLNVGDEQQVLVRGKTGC